MEEIKATIIEENKESINQIAKLRKENAKLKSEVKSLKEELARTPLPNKESSNPKGLSSIKHLHKREILLPKDLSFSIEEPMPLLIETKAFASPDAKSNTEPYTNIDERINESTVRIIRTMSPGMLIHIDEVKDRVEYWIEKLKQLTIETASLTKLKYMNKDFASPQKRLDPFDWAKKNVFSPAVKKYRLQSPRATTQKKSFKGDAKQKNSFAESRFNNNT